MKNNQQTEFEEAAKPLMKWLAERNNPEMAVIVNSQTAEIMSSVGMFTTEEFLNK